MVYSSGNDDYQWLFSSTEDDPSECRENGEKERIRERGWWLFPLWVAGNSGKGEVFLREGIGRKRRLVLFFFFLGFSLHAFKGGERELRREKERVSCERET